MDSPGLLYVTMQPRPGLSLDQFHEWYNNEHGPTRVRIPDIFTNGLRYGATDAAEPTFLAVYDVTRMSHLDTPTYLTLRANRSPREAETIGQVDVKRYFYDLRGEQHSSNFVPIEQLPDEEAHGITLVAVEVTLTAVEGAEQGYEAWMEEEHVPMLSKVPGWLRSRRYRTSSLDKGAPLRYLALHEYAKDNGLGGPEFKAATSTPWREQVFGKFIAEKGRRTYSPFYIFGPAPRDLSSLSRLPPSAAFTSADGLTSTTPGPWPVISSYVTAPDGLSIPYRLEGNPSPTAPTIAFCNSLLTSLHMWDPLVDILKSTRPEFRILRYDFRGRHAIPKPPVPSTLDLLSDDLAAVFSALRIPKLHALVGVSMGGATTTRFALKYPGKLDRFVACDFNVASSEANTNAWKERIAVAETPAAENEGGTPGIRKLAGMTVERWFHPDTVSSKKDVTNWVIDMVAANDVEGFRYGCQALWDYNMREAIKECKVPGLLVVGEGDGKGALVKAMEGFKGNVGASGVQLEIVPAAGHLPMCENPPAFYDAIKSFL